MEDSPTLKVCDSCMFCSALDNNAQNLSVNVVLVAPAAIVDVAGVTAAMF